MSISCFATSRELFDHCRSEHESDPPGDKSFRCALSGCDKSWKVGFTLSPGVLSVDFDKDT